MLGLDLPSSYPNRGFQPGALAIPCCAPAVATLAPCGRGVVGRGGSSQPGSEEHPALHQKEVYTGLGHQSVPQDPIRFKVQAGGSSREARASGSADSQRSGPDQPGKQDCLQGGEKATSCLWVSGKGWSLGQGGPYNPIPSTHLQVTT